jgi:DNA-binding NtrC family response regulator
MSLRSVLFVDPEPELRASCAAVAVHHGFAADTATAAGALDQMARGRYGVVAVDLDELGAHGGPLIEELSARYPETTYIAIMRRPRRADLPRRRLDVALATILVMPFEPDDLAHALGDAFELRDRPARRITS